MAAISQDKYIKIASSIVQATLGDRDLSGLVFTKAAVLETIPTEYQLYANTYNGNSIVTFSSARAVKEVFGEASDEYKFASKYFAYVNPSGRSPRALNFYKVGDGVTPKTAFENAIGESNNFGTFTFFGTYDLSALKEVYEYNKSLNFQFLAVHAETIDSANNITNATTLGSIEGTHFVVGTDALASYMPMAILSSVRYTTSSSATCLMFKRFDNETPSVTDDSVFEAFVPKHINFYGKTQVNGMNISFYQLGYNLDGTDTAVYMNEIWLKSRIITNFFNLMNEVERVPANYVGETIITSGVVMPAVNDALDCGVITPGKEIPESTKAIIYQYSGDEDAATTVETDGYWYDIDISPDPDDDKKYIATYKLIYSKADSVRFVDGTHKLV